MTQEPQPIERIWFSSAKRANREFELAPRWMISNNLEVQGHCLEASSPNLHPMENQGVRRLRGGSGASGIPSAPRRELALELVQEELLGGKGERRGGRPL